ncbi:MAG: hypothetical protein ABFD64_13530 [Armatimonadota bacterium]
MDRILRSLLFNIILIALILGTTIMLFHAGRYGLSLLMFRPDTISGPIRTGDFYIIGMKDGKPVELIHEWSCSTHGIADTLSEQDKQNKATIHELEQIYGKRPIVWKSTGRAAELYTFYITKHDVKLANISLNSKPGEWPHTVRVRILKDDPKTKTQVVQTLVEGERDSWKSIYRVENNRVHVLKYLFYRDESAGILGLLASPVFLVIAAVFWRRIFRKRGWCGGNGE